MHYLLLADFFGFVMLGIMLLAILLEDWIFEGKLGLRPGRSLGLGFVISLGAVFSILHFCLRINIWTRGLFPQTSGYTAGQIIGIMVGISGLLLLIAYLINWKHLVPGGLYRKVSHLLGGCLAILLLYLSRYWAIVLSGWAVGALIAVEHIRKKPKGHFQQVVKIWFNPATREGEATFYASIAFAAGLFGLLLYLEPPFVCVGMMAVMVGDTAAYIIGKKYGRHKWWYSRKKSIEGTAAGIVAASGCSLPVVLLSPISFLAVLIGLSSAMLLESLPISNADNAILPLSCGYITYGMTLLL